MNLFNTFKAIIFTATAILLLSCSSATIEADPYLGTTREPQPTATPRPTSTPQIFLMPRRPTPSQTPTPEPSPTDTPQPTSTPDIESEPRFQKLSQPTAAPATDSSSPTALPIEPLGPKVEIVCVFFDGAEPRSEGDEYVEIANSGDAPQSIGGWTLVDSTDGRPAFVFPPTLLDPGTSVRVYTDEVHPETGGFSFESGVSIWNNSANDADIAALIDQNGQTVSTKSYPPGC